MVWLEMARQCRTPAPLIVLSGEELGQWKSFPRGELISVSEYRLEAERD